MKYKILYNLLLLREFYTTLERNLTKHFLEKFSPYYKLFSEMVFKSTGYTLETIFNSLTVSILIQIVIKLFLSLFFIKLQVYLQFIFLFILLPLYLRHETFNFVRIKIAHFLLFYLPESSYGEDFDIEEFDGDFPEDAGDQQTEWYNYMLLYIVNFLISFRLLVMQEPILAIGIKFLIINFFMTNNSLFFAYLTSLMFIFSRFIFLLSDGTYPNWNLGLSLCSGSINKHIFCLNKKNVYMMTFWALRGVPFFSIHIKYETYKNNFLSTLNNKHLSILKKKFFKRSNIIFFKTTQENRYLRLFVFMVSIYIIINFLAFFERFSNIPTDIKKELFNSNVIYFIERYPKKTWKPENEIEKLLFNKLPGHHCLFKIKQSTQNLNMEITTFTSITTNKITLNNNLTFPYAFPLIPSIVIPKGLQGVSGLTQRFLITPEFDFGTIFNDLIDDSNFKFVYNPKKFHELNFSNLANLDLKIQSNNIFLSKKKFRKYLFS